MTKSKAWVRPVVLLAFALACGWIIVNLVGQVDWGAVADALSRLALWQFPLLLAALMVRQVLNALPLALFIRGLSVYRAVVNDLAAHLLAVVAPPPSDLVMRVGMFRSWGIDSSRAIAGATMNALTFYVNRFAAPVIGLLLFAGLEVAGANRSSRWRAGCSRWRSPSWSSSSSGPTGSPPRSADAAAAWPSG